MEKTISRTDQKRQYNEKNYERIYLQVPKDLGQAFKAKCASEGVSQRQVLIDAISEYVK